MLLLKVADVHSIHPLGQRPEAQMNRFEKLIKALDDKIAEVKDLFAAILGGVDFEGAREELARVVEILRDPNAALTRVTANYVGAQAELALEKIRAQEQKFLISQFAVDTMRNRMFGLDREILALHAADLGERITLYDAERAMGRNYDELRRQYLSFKALMRRLEEKGRQIVAQRAERALRQPEVIGSIGRRVGRSAEKRLQDAERRSRMKGAKLQDDSKGHSKRKQKSA